MVKLALSGIVLALLCLTQIQPSLAKKKQRGYQKDHMQEVASMKCVEEAKFVYEMECIEVGVTNIKLVGKSQDGYMEGADINELKVQFFCEEDPVQAASASSQMYRMAKSAQDWVGAADNSEYTEIDYNYNIKQLGDAGYSPPGKGSPNSLWRDCKMGKPLKFAITELDNYSGHDYGDITLQPAQYLLSAADSLEMTVEIELQDNWSAKAMQLAIIVIGEIPIFGDIIAIALESLWTGQICLGDVLIQFVPVGGAAKGVGKGLKRGSLLQGWQRNLQKEGKKELQKALNEAVQEGSQEFVDAIKEETGFPIDQTPGSMDQCVPTTRYNEKNIGMAVEWLEKVYQNKRNRMNMGLNLVEALWGDSKCANIYEDSGQGHYEIKFKFTATCYDVPDASSTGYMKQAVNYLIGGPSISDPVSKFYYGQDGAIGPTRAAGCMDDAVDLKISMVVSAALAAFLAFY